MLRPATPLTALLLVSFVLLLLSVISTPVIKGLPLASNDGVNFGVFGYCQGSLCSPIRVGYISSTARPAKTMLVIYTDIVAGKAFNEENNSHFSLSFNTRHTLSSILIVHPIAAFMNLVCLGLAAAAHFHSPSHSARYLLGLLILLFPTLLITLLAFLVDILLFVPHLAWGGWIVLASTILITASGVVTCAMRRTLVSRKARKKRIAENAEMSGENFYGRQSQEAKMVSPILPPLTTQLKPPMVNGAPGSDNLPNFATYEASRRSDDERRPLNQRTPSSSRGNTMPRTDASDPYGVPPVRSKSQQPATGARDEYGNPLPPSNAFGPMPGPIGRQPSEGRRNQSLPPAPGQYNRDNAFSPQRGGGYGPPRGRGGYPPRGGSYGPRGGYTGPQGPPGSSQGYGGRGGYNQRGGYAGRGRGGFAMDGVAAAGAGVAAGAIMNRGPRAPPPGYPTQDQYGRPMPEGVQSPVDGAVVGREDPYGPAGASEYGQPPAGTIAPAAAYGARRQSPARGQSPYGSRNQSPAGGIRQNEPMPPMPPMPGHPMGQAHEMDANLPPPAAYTGSHNNSLRDDDTDVQGMVGLQQNRQGLPSSPYPQAEYVPPRTAWAGAHHAATVDPNASARRMQSPVELPSTQSNVGGMDGAYSPSRNPPNHRPRVSSGGSDHYYEDVSPRFAVETDPPPQAEPVPSLLTPGPRHPPAPLRQVPGPNGEMIPLTSSYENLQEGACSPVESETSNFTSVSQRGVNPNWRPGNGDGAFNTGLGPPSRRIQQQTQMRRDVLLNDNPDFAIPGLAGSSRGGRGGMRGGGTVRRPVGLPPAASSVGMGGEGRYPVGP